MGFLALSEIIPPGTIFPYGGSVAPTGWLICDGSSISRAEYAALFSVIGTSFGDGVSSTTMFNLPDLRGMFLRGRAPNVSATLSSVSTAESSFRLPAGTVNRFGMRVRLTTTGTLPAGYATNTDYYTVLMNLISTTQQKLSLATSYANALAGVAVSITSVGSGTHTIVQWEDPDASSRPASNVGAATGNAVGSRQDDSIQAHRHRVTASSMGGNQAWNGGAYWASADGASGPGYKDTDDADGAASDSVRGPTRLSGETRVKNVTVNYIIKI